MGKIDNDLKVKDLQYVATILNSYIYHNDEKVLDWSVSGKVVIITSVKSYVYEFDEFIINYLVPIICKGHPAKSSDFHFALTSGSQTPIEWIKNELNEQPKLTY